MDVEKRETSDICDWYRYVHMVLFKWIYSFEIKGMFAKQHTPVFASNSHCCYPRNLPFEATDKCAILIKVYIVSKAKTFFKMLRLQYFC